MKWGELYEDDPYQSPSFLSGRTGLILSVLFREFLGLEIHIERTDRCDTLITAAEGGEVIVADGCFLARDRWLTAESLPGDLERWDSRLLWEDLSLVRPGVPVIYGSRLQRMVGSIKRVREFAWDSTSLEALSLCSPATRR